MTRIGDDCLGHFHLAKIVIEQGAIRIDGRDADHRIIHLELTNKIDCRLADNATIGAAHHATAMMTSMEGKIRSRFATLILLVMTISSW